MRAMCLWSPAEPRLLNQSAGCDRLTGREIERVVRMCVCVCLLEKNKRKRDEKLRQRGRLTDADRHKKINQKAKRRIGQTSRNIQREGARDTYCSHTWRMREQRVEEAKLSVA